MKKKLLLIAMVALMFSCSSPLDKKFNEETAKEDIQTIKDKIDSTELQLLAGSMIRLKFQDKKLEDMTYAEILEDGKKWKAEQEKIEAEQKALAEKAAREEAKRIKKLTEAVIVSCFEKGYTEVDYQDYITYKFVIQNKSDKAIRAVKGGITFTNLFDEEIKSLNFVYDQPIPAGQEVNWNATTDYNQFMDDDKTLKNKDLKDLKIVWKPEKVIFEDGTTLE
ncbi:hypothetical protein [Zobellia galactanivorans]|uniref:Conserved hypothetical lipoprotein n=1 Tax=Zobellia galactanivorans (strain DSM 12802 / CCUG 47099 / CIP 106680 / NCIMB 13871 / Dsij) TaxID=63186 RepID=G0L0E1_ZOBGA|nr:hypothetical protein [Zobellia galactanivorans]CAZ94354.1 Conserved hypothetical lipoprotein [Zobellia galactanivorans]